jgi:hypothetical protein
MVKRVMVLALGWLAAAPSAQAIPAFARRYEVACSFCHEGHPKLNRMGERFRERGFRMSQEDDFDLGAWGRTVPVDLRARATHFADDSSEDVDEALLKAMSAGHLGRRLSYWVDDGLRIGDGDDTVRHTRPDNAWARLEIVGAGKLYLRAGRFELDLPFTQARTPHVFPYDIYFANTGFESDAVGFHQDGVEVGGQLPRDVRWSAAVVSGHDGPADADHGFEGNVFLRIAKGLRQHRVGGFAYVGHNTFSWMPGASAENTLLRLGADANVWIRRLNLYGVALYGRNGNSVVTTGARAATGQPLSFSGGFLQADWHVREVIVLTLRGNLLRKPSGLSVASRVTDTSVFPGVQVFVRERVKLAFEYGFTNRARPDVGALQLDITF